MNGIDSDETQSTHHNAVHSTKHDPDRATHEATTTAVEDSGDIPEFLAFLTANAILAPSWRNSQPWRFYAQADSLWVIHDRARSDNLIDADKHGAFVALGAAVENVRLAALSRGYRTQIDYFPQTNFSVPLDLDVIARIQPAANAAKKETANDIDRLTYQQIASRQTDRKIYGRSPLIKDSRRQLHQLAKTSGCTLTLLEDEASLAELGTLVSEANRLRMLFDDAHREMMDEIRWSSHAAEVTRDGIDVATLDISLSELVASQTVKDQDAAQFVRSHGGADVLAQQSNNAVLGSSAVGLVSVSGHTKQAQLRGGQAIQRLWLLATALGLALHPITALIYLFNTNLSPRLESAERSKLCELCDRFDLLFPKEAQDCQLMLFRLSNGQSERKRSRRRPVSEVLSTLPNANSSSAREG